jgi:N-acetylglucosaminyldiphosphoundecaprenol N-acetyl-beta-D-mannosaminyltransferase
MDYHPAGIPRISLLKVPVDIIPEDAIAGLARDFATQPGQKAVVFLTFRTLMKANRDPEFLSQLKTASLIVPVSKSLELACRFLKLPQPIRHYPFDFTVKLLGALEEKRQTIYLLGENHNGLQTVAGTMRATFPGLTLVGRHSGFYTRENEAPILTAIHKATPTVLFLGPGVAGREKWIFRQGKGLPVRISLYSEDTFAIMAGRKKRPTKSGFRKGIHELPRTIVNPLRIVRIYNYFWFGILLLVYRLKRNA